ncbi:MAG TPA: sec-independent translocase [Marmoricola sp.]|nr:sec-independent translocase [Marmoricola sp.]
MFGVGIPEMVVILVVAVFVFGPERLPEFARQAGRMARQLRRLALSAQDDLRRELGPDYADLKLTDLDPRVAFRKHILEAMEDDDPSTNGRVVPAVDRVAGGGVPLGPGERPPYDVEAT